MKITKEKLKQAINLVREIKGTLTLIYIPSRKIEKAEDAYGLYYSSPNEIRISDEFYVAGGKLNEIKDIGIDFVIDDAFEILNDSILDYLKEALDNLELCDEDLKYFDEDEKLFKKFQDEVRKLKNSDK